MVRASQVQWGEGWNDRPIYPILVAKLGRAVEVVAAAPCLLVPTHWHEDKRKTLPCPGPTHGCFLCHTIRPRPKGYLAAWYGSGKRVVVEVTEGAMRAIPDLRSPACVGRWFRFERRGQRNNGSLFVVAMEKPPLREYPEAHDIKPTLLDMWGLPD